MTTRCSVCRNSNAEEINRALLDGSESLARIAIRFSVPTSSLHRHRKKHLPALRQASFGREPREPWHRAITRCARNLRMKYGPVDQLQATRIARLLRASLVPRRPPGRKPSLAVTVAAELRQRGTRWSEIYPIALPELSSLPWDVQSWRKYNLRRAVYSFRKRRRT